MQAMLGQQAQESFGVLKTIHSCKFLVRLCTGSNKSLPRTTSSHLIGLAKANRGPSRNRRSKIKPSNVLQAGLMLIVMQSTHPRHPARSSQSIATCGKRASCRQRSK